jgi:hypothetical protein
LQVTLISAQQRLARDILPGSYSFADVVEFSDLPPKYTLFQVTVMSAQWHLVRDILPGSYPLAHIVEFSDLAMLLPNYTFICR